MKLKTKTILFLFAVLIFFVFQKNIAFAGGFGVSPSSVENKNLIPGSYYEQDVFLVQSQPDVDLNATVKVDAGKISNWIKIENGNNFLIPKGEHQFQMKVDVAVPSDANLGEYKGTITINTSPAGAQKSGVSVVLGADVGVDLNVTDVKVSDFSIQNFQISDVLKGSPIKFVMKVKNDGNIENGPTKVGLTFFDQYHSKQLGQQEELIAEKVQPFKTKNISAEFPNNFDVGPYWADVKIYSDDKTIAESNIVFNVVSALAVQKHQISGLPNFSAIPVWEYLLAGAIIIIIILLAVIIIILHKNTK
jgi:hypothetical protein